LASDANILTSSAVNAGGPVSTSANRLGTKISSLFSGCKNNNTVSTPPGHSREGVDNTAVFFFFFLVLSAGTGWAKGLGEKDGSALSAAARVAAVAATAATSASVTGLSGALVTNPAPAASPPSPLPFPAALAVPLAAPVAAPAPAVWRVARVMGLVMMVAALPAERSVL
jgi:hypothetical protein